jgi:hypothetical protein
VIGSLLSTFEQELNMKITLSLLALLLVLPATMATPFSRRAEKCAASTRQEGHVPARENGLLAGPDPAFQC